MPLKHKGTLIIEDVFERPKMAAVRTSHRITKLNKKTNILIKYL
jgi:hypothetical protein